MPTTIRGLSEWAERVTLAMRTMTPGQRERALELARTTGMDTEQAIDRVKAESSLEDFERVYPALARLTRLTK